MGQTNPKKGGNKGIAAARADQRRDDAYARTHDTSCLTIEERLERIAQRPGESRRERERLEAQLAVAKVKTKKRLEKEQPSGKVIPAGRHKVKGEG